MTNVVYFKTTWANHFSQRRTHEAIFNVSSSESTIVNMMVATEDFRYGYLPQLDSKMVVLPYNVRQLIG